LWVREFHQPARDFWDTPPRHFWWLMGHLRDEAEAKTPGPRLSRNDRQEIEDMLAEAKAQERREKARGKR